MVVGGLGLRLAGLVALQGVVSPGPGTKPVASAMAGGLSAPGPEKSILRPRPCTFLPFGRAVSSSGAEKPSGCLE